MSQTLDEGHVRQKLNELKRYNMHRGVEILKSLEKSGTLSYYQIVSKQGVSVSNIYEVIQRLRNIDLVEINDIPSTVGQTKKAIRLTPIGKAVVERMIATRERVALPKLKDNFLTYTVQTVPSETLSASCFNMCFDLDQSLITKAQPGDSMMRYARKLNLLLSFSRSLTVGGLASLSGVSIPKSTMRSILRNYWNYGFAHTAQTYDYLYKAEKFGLAEVDALTIYPKEEPMGDVQKTVQLAGDKLKESLTNAGTYIQIKYLLIYADASYHLFRADELPVGGQFVSQAMMNPRMVANVTKEMVESGILKQESESGYLIPGRVYRYYPEQVEFSLKKIDGDSLESVIARHLVNLGASTLTDIATRLKYSEAEVTSVQVEQALHNLLDYGFCTAIRPAFRRTEVFWIPIWSPAYKDIQSVAEEWTIPGIGLGLALAKDTHSSSDQPLSNEIVKRLAKHRSLNILDEFGDDKKTLALATRFVTELANITGLVRSDQDNPLAFKVVDYNAINRLQMALQNIDLHALQNMVEEIGRSRVRPNRDMTRQMQTKSLSEIEKETNGKLTKIENADKAAFRSLSDPEYKRKA